MSASAQWSSVTCDPAAIKKGFKSVTQKDSCRDTGVLHIEARPAVAINIIEGAGAHNTWGKVRKEKGEKAYLKQDYRVDGARLPLEMHSKKERQETKHKKINSN